MDHVLLSFQCCNSFIARYGRRELMDMSDDFVMGADSIFVKEVYHAHGISN